MANMYGSSYEKVTFNMPIELKQKVLKLKEELNISLSTIYNEAIENYIKQKELERWKRGVSLALKDSEYKKLSEELSSDIGDIYEY